MKNQFNSHHLKSKYIARNLFVLFLATLLLSGCSKSLPKSESTTPPTTPDVTEDAAKPEENTDANTPVKETQKNEDVTNSQSAAQYQVVTKEYNKDAIHIKYPQLSGLADEKKQTAINDLLMNDIIDSQVNSAYESGYATTEAPLTLDLDYQVKLSTDDLLSISYEGNSYVEGGAFPSNFFYGVTLDLKNQKKLYLSNFTDINIDLIDKMKNAKTVSNQSLGIVEDKEIQESLITAFNNNLDTLGSSFMIWSLSHNSESNFYVTDESLFVSYDIGHVLGDYALFEIPGQNVANYAQTYDSNLCLPSENLVVRFDMKDSDKTLAICMDKKKSYLVYRFGTKDKIEFEYPEDKQNSIDKFSYQHNNSDAPAGATQDEADVTLTFKNGDYEYVVYERSSGQVEAVGVKVTNLSTKKVTDKQGDPSTFAGSWYDLDDIFETAINN